jgi:hypothetical protein
MLYNTVMCDERTCLWFRKLFTLPLVIERMKESMEGQAIQRRFKVHSFIAAILSVVSLILFLAGIFFFQQFFMVLSILTAVTAVGCVLFLLQARRDLAACSVHLFTLDREIIPRGTTLFQLGEIYSRKYQAPSLVTVIWIWDQWLRNACIALFCMAFGVLFLPVWGQFLGIVVGCCLTACLVKILVMARQDLKERSSFRGIVNKFHDNGKNQNESSYK